MHEPNLTSRSPVAGDDGGGLQPLDVREKGIEASRRAPRPTADEKSAAVADPDPNIQAQHVGERVLYMGEPGKLWPADVTAVNTNGSYALHVMPDNANPFTTNGVREGDGIGFYRLSALNPGGAVSGSAAPAEPTQIESPPPVARDVNPAARADVLPGGEVRTGEALANPGNPAANDVAPGTANAAELAPNEVKTSGHPSRRSGT